MEVVPGLEGAISHLRLESALRDHRAVRHSRFDLHRQSGRARVAQVLGHDETYFWPRLLGSVETRNATNSELVQIWPTRGDVPGDVWRSLFAQAAADVDLLVYSGGFLIEAHNLVDIIETKAAAGTNFRLLIGDPRCEAVRLRSRDEQLPSLPERCRSTQEYLRPVADLPGVSIRTHQTTLYASQYRFDGSMLVKPAHVRFRRRSGAGAAPAAGARRPAVRLLQQSFRAGLGDG